MKAPVRLLALATTAILAFGCAGTSSPPPQDRAYDDNGPSDAGPNGPGGGPGGPGGPGKPGDLDRFSPAQVLLRYDADHDGKITRAELDAGLKADFEAADTNHDGKLDADEVRAVNDKRWKELGAASSPLVDWNGDGFVDFNEFAGAVRSLFVQMDLNGDGVLSPQELNPRQPPAKGKDKGRPQGSRGGAGGPGGPGQ